MAKHFPGYSKAIDTVKAQSLEENLQLLDSLFGRGNLEYGDNPEAVKTEALRQLEMEWTDEAWEKEWGALVRATSRGI